MPQTNRMFRQSRHLNRGSSTASYTKSDRHPFNRRLLLDEDAHENICEIKILGNIAHNRPQNVSVHESVRNIRVAHPNSSAQKDNETENSRNKRAMDSVCAIDSSAKNRIGRIARLPN